MSKVDATLYFPLLDGYIFQNVTQGKYFPSPFSERCNEFLLICSFVSIRLIFRINVITFGLV